MPRKESESRKLAELVAKQRGIKVKSAQNWLRRVASGKVKKPKYNLTSYAKKKVIRYVKRERGESFSVMRTEKIESTRRNITRYTYPIYSGLAPVSTDRIILLTKNFFAFLAKKHKPTDRDQIGVIYIGEQDEFSFQPRLWRDRQALIIDRLSEMARKYKFRVVYAIGWIEKVI